MAYPPPHMGGYGVPQAGISIDALNDDIQRLITASKAQVALAPHDPSVQTRLKALMDLQTILQTQNLPQDQLVLVKNQIADLAVTIRAPPTQTPTPTLTSAPIAPIPQQPVAVAPPPVAAPKISIDSLFGAGALASLMSRKSATPQASASHSRPAPIAVPTPPPQRVEPQKPANPQPAAPVADPMALMNMLRQAGLLPAAAPASSSVAASRPMPSAATLSALVGAASKVPPMQPTRPPTLEALTGDIILRTSSLKQYVSYIYICAELNQTNITSDSDLIYSLSSSSF